MRAKGALPHLSHSLPIYWFISKSWKFSLNLYFSLERTTFLKRSSFSWKTPIRSRSPSPWRPETRANWSLFWPATTDFSVCENSKSNGTKFETTHSYHIAPNIKYPVKDGTTLTTMTQTVSISLTLEHTRLINLPLPVRIVPTTCHQAWSILKKLSIPKSKYIESKFFFNIKIGFHRIGFWNL